MHFSTLIVLVLSFAHSLVANPVRIGIDINDHDAEASRFVSKLDDVELPSPFRLRAIPADVSDNDHLFVGFGFPTRSPRPNSLIALTPVRDVVFTLKGKDLMVANCPIQPQGESRLLLVNWPGSAVGSPFGWKMVDDSPAGRVLVPTFQDDIIDNGECSNHVRSCAIC